MNYDSGLPMVDNTVSNDYKEEISSLLDIEVNVNIYTISLNRI